jgi:hypothetical protein
MKINFTPTFEVVEDYCPQPSSKFLPDWYRELDSYVDNVKRPSGNGTTSATVKRCMPVFDMMTAGYIIPTYVDIFVSQREQVDPNDPTKFEVYPWYEWSSQGVISFHPIDQAITHPGRKVHKGNFPKFANPWSIVTPPGYSCLFIPPVHRDSPFSILSGLVDTDSYKAPVNFPFILNDSSFEGLIPAGTPLAQVIPIKRDNWSMEINNDISLSNKDSLKLRSKFFDSYKTQFRNNKEYK